MPFKNFRHATPSRITLVVVTLLLSGLFKGSAFAREAFIAARFGLSSVTDAYFTFQQFPVTAASFMLGAFGVAFTPAYADSRKTTGHVAWLPGLLLYGCLAGLLLSVATWASGPLLMKAFAQSTSGAQRTLELLSVNFAPIFCVGIWSGMCVARGQNLMGLTINGLPYLSMTIVLLASAGFGLLNDLSLPFSMTAGWVLIGAVGLLQAVPSEPWRARAHNILFPWRNDGFRHFCRQLGATSVENVGFATNQLLIIYFIARAGVGAVSANNCAMRIGMLALTVLTQPLSQLVTARLSVMEQRERTVLFRRWIVVLGAVVIAFSAAIYVFRMSVIRLVYLHGKFTATDLNLVLAILPAWLAYVVVQSMNGVTARYLFFLSEGGSKYVRRMLWAYAGANLLRFALDSRMTSASVVWCSVLTETCALGLSLLSVFRQSHPSEQGLALAEGVQEAY